MGNTIGSLKLMVQNLPDDMPIVIEDANNGYQYSPFQMGLAACLNAGSNGRHGSYAFDGEDEEANFDADKRAFMFRCG
jgi:hypothetical protein